MKATALTTPGTQIITAGWILELTTRWKLAAEYVSDLGDPGAVKAETMLRRLIQEDFPLLVRELIRLRPELA